VFEDVVQHSKRAMESWKNSIQKEVPGIVWIHGNALNINPEKGEALVGFDRIYVGASVENEDITKLTRLLRPGGILVGPGKSRITIALSCLTKRCSTSYTCSLLISLVTS
jgi:protein-L-isoaspartate O-methyltransferase